MKGKKRKATLTVAVACINIGLTLVAQQGRYKVGVGMLGMGALLILVYDELNMKQIPATARDLQEFAEYVTEIVDSDSKNKK